jgi:predicted O-methyltransferase YrrM
MEDLFRYTKTRVTNPKPANILTDMWGMEQTFLLKSVVDYLKPKKILEIGTGRGTGSYAMSTVDSVEEVITLDIVPYEQKQNTAIDFEPAQVSNADIYSMVNCNTKSKIKFLDRQSYVPTDDFDFAYIDGEHEDYNIILQDFVLAKCVLENNGVIVWDDYDVKRFAVKPVIENICKYNPDIRTILVEFRGHIFNEYLEDRVEKEAGFVIMYNKNSEFVWG